MRSKEIEKTLTQAIEEARRQGYKIMRDVTMSDGPKRCCAIGAVGIVLHEYTSAFNLGSLIGLYYDETCAVIGGFDGRPHHHPTPRLRNLYRVGRRLARKYVNA